MFDLRIDAGEYQQHCDKCGKAASDSDPIVNMIWKTRTDNHVISIHTSHLTRAFAKYNKVAGRLVIV